MTYRRRLAAVLVSLAVGTALLAALLVGALATRRLQASLAENLQGVVATAALKLDAEAFARIVTPAHPEVEQIRRELEAVAAANPQLSNLYAGRAMGDDFVYIVDGFARNGELAPFGERYPLEPEMREALGGTATANPQLVSDRFGTWISGYAPIRETDGQVVGIIGADASAVTVHQAWRSFAVGAGLLVLLVLLISVGAALLLGRALARPVDQLLEGLRRLARGESAAVRIDDPAEFAVLGDAFNEAERSVRERDALRGIFGTFLEKDVAAKILGDLRPEGIEGELRRITVLFSDIRGYTRWSEDKHPLDLLTALNGFFSRMIDAVLREHGTIDKFIGDALMVLFGAPQSREDHADRAVAAAIRMQSAVRTGKFPFATGIGINTGDVVLGTVGSTKRMSYTAMGDNVNLAQRLEGAAKPGQILISRETFFALQRPERFEIAKVPSLTLKGKSQRIEAYEVRGFAPRAQKRTTTKRVRAVRRKRAA